MTISRHGPPCTRRAAVFGLAALAIGSGPAGAASPDELSQRIQAARVREQALRAGINADSGRVNSFDGRIGELHTRVDAVPAIVEYENGQLAASEGSWGERGRGGTASRRG